MSSIPSSSSALSRARSLRKPSKPETGIGIGGETRNVSPSRLPVKGQQPGTAPGALTATRPSRSATTSAAATKSSRPLSGVFARITSSSTRAREKDSPAPEASPPSRLTRAASLRQPSASARPATSGGATVAGPRPTTSSGVPTARRVASGASTGQGPDKAPGIRHARAKSSVTTLSSATTLRPPSQTSTGSSSTTTTAADRSRPPLTSLTRRPAGTAPAPPSPTTTSATTPRRRSSLTSTTAQPSKPAPAKQPPQLSKPLPHPPSHKPTTATSTGTGPNGNGSNGIPKPAFTTNQQSYTPLKPPAPKPLTSTFLLPPSPSKQPANIALSAETARLQTELLQLHLLHRDAGRVVSEWKGDAREKLKGRFEGVRGLGEEVRVVEREVEEGRNIAALREWALLAGGGGIEGVKGGREDGVKGLEEKIVLLDAVVSGVWSVVGEPGGRYERVVRGFGEWVGMVEGILLGRKRQQQNGQGVEEGEEEANLEFTPPLPPAWHEETAHLARRLDDWRRKLRELGDLPTTSSTTPNNNHENQETEPQSSLARILSGCRALVHGMLDELDVMDQIQREAAAEEMRWVREMNRRGLGGTDEGAPRAGAIWRVL